jgi:acyl carrier protein
MSATRKDIMSNHGSDKEKEKLIPTEDHCSSEVTSSEPDCVLQGPTSQSRNRNYVAPRDEIEAGIADILAELLKIQRVGANDNLILLGGESLLAAQAAWHIQNRFGCELTLRSILTGTVAHIAELVKATGNQPSDPSV